ASPAARLQTQQRGVWSALLRENVVRPLGHGDVTPVFVVGGIRLGRRRLVTAGGSGRGRRGGLALAIPSSACAAAGLLLRLRRSLVPVDARLGDRFGFVAELTVREVDL